MKHLILILSTLLSLNVFAKRKELDEVAKKQVIRVLEANEALHAAFFEYKSAEVEGQAKKVLGLISEIKNEEISQILKFSTEKLKLLTSTESRENNNTNYGIFSAALVHIVNKYNVGESYNAYSCPMVKKKWVQNSKKINKVHNPYAPEMPHCGGKVTRF